MNSFQLDGKYRELGFELFCNENDSLILKHQDTLVCIIGSRLILKDEILARICNEYIEKYGVL